MLTEMKTFVGLKMTMGSMKSNNYIKYWQTKSPVIRTPGFGEIMSRNRVLTILRFVCFHDVDEEVPHRGEPGYNKTHKIQEFMDIINEKFKTNYSL